MLSDDSLSNINWTIASSTCVIQNIDLGTSTVLFKYCSFKDFSLAEAGTPSGLALNRLNLCFFLPQL